MANLKLTAMSTSELCSLWAFSKDMLTLWTNSTEPNIEKYYKTISDEIRDEINGRLEGVFPNITHLIE